MIGIVVRDLQDVFVYWPYGFLGGFLGPLLYWLGGKKERNGITAWKSYFFAAYLVFILEISLLSREPGTRSAFDLVPFSTWGTTMRAHAYVVENVIMFLPMGVFLPALWKRFEKLAACIGCSFLFSLAIESTQAVTERGYFQTDDLIMNVLGAVLGYGCFYLVNRFGLRKKK